VLWIWRFEAYAFAAYFDEGIVMRYLFLLAFLVCATLHAAQEEVIPDENATRKKIDTLIKDCKDSKRKATLGLIQQTFGLSISYGAPTWNQGDHESCFRFYAKTAQSLCNAFGDAASTTDAAHESIVELKATLERAGKTADIDRNAWTMRFAFDKHQLACTVQAEHIQGLVDMGSQYFRRSQFEEAQDAFQTGVSMLGELEGDSLEGIPGACRFAPLALTNALFAQKKYKEAVQPIALGLKFMPNWPTMTFDLRTLHHSPDEYEDLLKDLEQAAKTSADNADIQFLLGYEYHFTGKKSAAQEQFKKALALDPAHAAAKAFSKTVEAPDGEMDPKKSKVR
jgi:tetratricopeptide (TPR) repeat protein